MHHEALALMRVAPAALRLRAAVLLCATPTACILLNSTASPALPSSLLSAIQRMDNEDATQAPIVPVVT